MIVGDAATREGAGYVERSGEDRTVIRDISDNLNFGLEAGRERSR